MSYQPGQTVVCEKQLRAGERILPPFTPMTVVQVEAQNVLVRLSDGAVLRVRADDLKPFHDTTTVRPNVEPSQPAQVTAPSHSTRSSGRDNAWDTWRFGMLLVIAFVIVSASFEGFQLHEKTYNDPLFWLFMGWGAVSAYSLSEVATSPERSGRPSWFKPVCVGLIVMGVLSALVLGSQGRLW